MLMATEVPSWWLAPSLAASLYPLDTRLYVAGGTLNPGWVCRWGGPYGP